MRGHYMCVLRVYVPPRPTGNQHIYGYYKILQLSVCVRSHFPQQVLQKQTLVDWPL